MLLLVQHTNNDVNNNCYNNFYYYNCRYYRDNHQIASKNFINTPGCKTAAPPV